MVDVDATSSFCGLNDDGTVPIATVAGTFSATGSLGVYYGHSEC